MESNSLRRILRSCGRERAEELVSLREDDELTCESCPMCAEVFMPPFYEGRGVYVCVEGSEVNWGLCRLEEPACDVFYQEVEDLASYWRALDAFDRDEAIFDAGREAAWDV